MSYNVRLFNLYEWLPNDDVPFQISNLLLDEQPDILCLQDFSPNDDVNVNIFKYKTVKLEGDRLKFGQAIYSKFKIVNSGEIEFPNSFNSVIYADILKDKDTLRVYSMHLESIKISADINQEMDEKRSKFIFNNISKAFSQQQHQAELIKEHYLSCHHPKIICGDMNNSAFSYVYRTIKGELKDAFEEAGTGFGKSYNYKYYPARIDYIFVDNTIEVKQFSSLDYFIQSDHFPQIVRLKFNSKE
jgi:endonuclease/exonuclease/phosphatase family metal-dependent hydrolase